MPESILVAYASQHGATVDVAAAIGEVLAQHAKRVDVVPVTDVEALDEYDAVVLGSPFYSSNWLPEAVAFVNQYGPRLATMSTAMFTLAIRLRDSSPEIQEVYEGYLHSAQAAVKPASVGYFAGALDLSKLSAITRLQVETKNLPEGDFRDFEKIKAWAAELPALFDNLLDL